MINKGDKVKLVKPITQPFSNYLNVGDICEVLDVSNKDRILIRLSQGYIGSISYDELIKYFEKVKANNYISYDNHNSFNFNSKLVNQNNCSNCFGCSMCDECYDDCDDLEINSMDIAEDILSESEFNVMTVFDKCTIVSCRLPNNFVIVEYSACISPEDYDIDIGVKICMNRIKNKICEMIAYQICDNNMINN